MDARLDTQLCKNFPLLYKQRNLPMRQTAMCWGFSCGDGWFNIIHDLSEKLEKLIEDEMKNPDNYQHRDYYPSASQVKEKFGGLRFYMSTETDEMSDLISEAEKKSFETCEDCGEPGEVRAGGWIKTLCDKHNSQE